MDLKFREAQGLAQVRLQHQGQRGPVLDPGAAMFPVSPCNRPMLGLPQFERGRGPHLTGRVLHRVPDTVRDTQDKMQRLNGPDDGFFTGLDTDRVELAVTRITINFKFVDKLFHGL